MDSSSSSSIFFIIYHFTLFFPLTRLLLTGLTVKNDAFPLFYFFSRRQRSGNMKMEYRVFGSSLPAIFLFCSVEVDYNCV
ncbi:hypothetical protein OIU74_007704, partial [Salix koriyanagi]